MDTTKNAEAPTTVTCAICRETVKVRYNAGIKGYVTGAHGNHCNGGRARVYLVEGRFTFGRP